MCITIPHDQFVVSDLPQLWSLDYVILRPEKVWEKVCPSSLLITLLVITVLVLPLPSIQAASPVTNKFATNLVFDVGQDHYDSHLRANGVYLLPRRQVAIAAIDDVLSPVHQRRLQVVFADLDSVSGTYGDV